MVCYDLVPWSSALVSEQPKEEIATIQCSLFRSEFIPRLPASHVDSSFPLLTSRARFHRSIDSRCVEKSTWSNLFVPKRLNKYSGKSARFGVGHYVEGGRSRKSRSTKPGLAAACLSHHNNSILNIYLYSNIVVLTRVGQVQLESPVLLYWQFMRA